MNAHKICNRRVTALALTAMAWLPLGDAQPSGSDGKQGAPVSLAQIEGLIGRAECQVDGECRAMGVGAKACGGPEAYRAWSTRQTDAGELQDLVARNAAARRIELDRLGMLSNCAMVPAPGAACVRAHAPSETGRCTLVLTGTGERAGAR